MVESLTLKQLVSVMNLNLGKQEGGVNPLVPRVRLWWGGMQRDYLGKREVLGGRRVCEAHSGPQVVGTRKPGARGLKLGAREGGFPSHMDISESF